MINKIKMSTIRRLITIAAAVTFVFAISAGKGYAEDNGSGAITGLAPEPAVIKERKERAKAGPAVAQSRLNEKKRGSETMDINELRKRIDLMDDALLRIFNERARLALEIGHLKKRLNLPVFDPAREKRIFARMKDENPGPLDNDAIVRLFERVVDESRRLERTMSHAYEHGGPDVR